eukprot:3227381-Pyramimonas_sp.AAC.1
MAHAPALEGFTLVETKGKADSKGSADPYPTGAGRGKGGGASARAQATSAAAAAASAAELSSTQTAWLTSDDGYFTESQLVSATPPAGAMEESDDRSPPAAPPGSIDELRAYVEDTKSSVLTGMAAMRQAMAALE